MVRPLRKFHFICWSILAFVIPVLSVLSVALRPSQPIAESDAVFIRINIGEEFRSDDEKKDITSIILIDATSSLRSSACLVYAIQNGKQLLLGNIYRQQKNSFRVTGNVEKVMLVDNLQGRILHEHIVTQK